MFLLYLRRHDAYVTLSKCLTQMCRANVYIKAVGASTPFQNGTSGKTTFLYQNDPGYCDFLIADQGTISIAVPFSEKIFYHRLQF